MKNKIKEVYISNELRMSVIVSTISLLIEMALSLTLLMCGTLYSIPLDSYSVWIIISGLSLISFLLITRKGALLYFCWSGVFWSANCWINKLFIFLNPMDNLISIKGLILALFIVFTSTIYFVTSMFIEHSTNPKNRK